MPAASFQARGTPWRQGVAAAGARHLFTATDLTSRPTPLVFGFTHCPDVCPTSLEYIAAVLKAFRSRTGAVRPVFLTVDPERDTTAVMAEYVALFDDQIVGLSGTPEEVAKVIKDLGVYARKVPQDGGGYMMDLTATMLLLDAEGRFRSALDIHEKPEVAVEKIRRLLEARPGTPKA